jgi:hypothetical protein
MQKSGRRARAFRASACVFLVFILRQYLVLVKCQFCYIKWVQIVRHFLPSTAQLRSHSFQNLFRARGGLAPFGTLELALYWYQDAN